MVAARLLLLGNSSSWSSSCMTLALRSSWMLFTTTRWRVRLLCPQKARQTVPGVFTVVGMHVRVANLEMQL